MANVRLEQEDRQALLRVRRQVLLVRRLGEQLARECPDGVRSATADGMPRGRGGVPGGLDVRLARIEGLRRIVERESAELRRLEERAREAMDKMTPELYAFCVMYYIGGMSIEETGEAIGRSLRQSMRYLRMIETEPEKTVRRGMTGRARGGNGGAMEA